MENELIKKIVKILADYKFNSTQIETTEIIAERIIGIVRAERDNEELEFLESLCDRIKFEWRVNSSIQERIQELKGGKK
jgi:hypothetical protein